MGSKVTVNMGHPIYSGYQISHNDVKYAGASVSGSAATSAFSVVPGPDSLNKRQHNQADATYQLTYPSDYSVSPSSVAVLGFLPTTTIVSTSGHNVNPSGWINPILQAAYQATGYNAPVSGTVNPVQSPDGITPIMKIGNDQSPVKPINTPALSTGTNHYSFNQSTHITPVNQSGNKGSMTYFNGNSIVTI